MTNGEKMAVLEMAGIIQSAYRKVYPKKSIRDLLIIASFLGGRKTASQIQKQHKISSDYYEAVMRRYANCLLLVNNKLREVNGIELIKSSFYYKEDGKFISFPYFLSPRAKNFLLLAYIKGTTIRLYSHIGNMVYLNKELMLEIYNGEGFSSLDGCGSKIEAELNQYVKDFLL